ncbi:MAG: valine--tRNA ligase [Spirochaetaceae bacterium]|jgi:valyl-tRNA synthetase|nr:valine--tRNA ligase [Spirochaetaceae bacterium]
MKAIELEKAYNPRDFEGRIYAAWVDKGCFKPKSDFCKDAGGVQKVAGGQTYVVVIPPPNVTGVLHMGHGLNHTLQDIAVRYHRMKGDDTLWVPGCDHAGIATQHVVEVRLKKEGLSRHDLGREKFLERTWQVKEEHHALIAAQQRKLGDSVDWDRERFTMDEGLSRAVREVFVTLYERGLVYRGNYLVNWCTSCGTALADDEVDHEDTPGAMYHIVYPLADGSGGIEIATTRPETMLADTAVAVHPGDGRYAALVGKQVNLPLTGRQIPVIADSYVDREFGTGAVKITPAHDPNDWDMAKRQNLQIINMLNPDGTLNENAPEKYRGLTCQAARKAVVEDIAAQGLFRGKEDITHPVGHCYRCNTVVEPFLSDQWFVRMKPLADKALASWKRGDLVFYPRKWENTYSRWMENIRDWCISRQLWWGHRIPVWYCDCGEVIVSRTDPERCPKCGADSSRLRQDPDVLDTWFSSWLWPFSTLGWPESRDGPRSSSQGPQSPSDFERFYPTTALVTAYDIIFFWVSRMIMAGLEFTGKAPFRDIYIHGLVRDKMGRKMSKSLGNGLDPLDLIAEYGSDAVKFTLAFMCAQGQDVLVDRDSFKLGSRFANKVWNAARYILGNLEGRALLPLGDCALSPLDKWVYSRLNAASASARSALESYRYNDAASALYEFFWNDFCDWYVEATKLSFRCEDEGEKDRAVSVLLNVLAESLRLLHPFLPFVTEEIWGKLPQALTADSAGRTGMLVNAAYPEPDGAREYPEIAGEFSALQELVRSIRALRIDAGIAPEVKLNIALKVMADTPAAGFSAYTGIIELLAGVRNITFTETNPPKAIAGGGAGYEVYLLVDGSVNAEQLIARFTREREREAQFVIKLEAKLAGSFSQKAPPEVVAQEREKLLTAKTRVQKLASYISNF